MSFTRFHDDPSRIKKENIETSMQNQYIFNVPGNTKNESVFFDDPHLRMQKNGNKLNNNLTHTENILFNINKPLNRDNILRKNYNINSLFTSTLPIQNVKDTITNESRTTDPAWLFREKTQFRPNILFHNPQKNTEVPFIHNSDTNILEKDYYNLNLCKKI